MNWSPVRHGGHRRPGLAVALLVAGLGLTACGSDDGKVALSTIPSFTATESPSATDQPTLTAPDPTTQPTSTPSVTATPSTRKTTTTRTTTTTKRTTSSSTTRPTTPTPTPSVSVTLPTVTQLLAAEASAASSATSTHVVGSVVTSAGSFGVDLRIGGNADGTLTYAKGTVSIRRVGSELYIMGSSAFFTGNGHPELVATHANKWMHILASDPAYDNIVPITYVSNWVNMVHAAPATAVKAATVGTTTMLALTGGSGAKANTVYLPLTGTARPSSVTSADGVDKLTFSQWNAAAPSVSTPTALVVEPDDAVMDVPTFPEATAIAFSGIWM
jgi:hypothetical protein